jgi:hypothetical protein
MPELTHDVASRQLTGAQLFENSPPLLAVGQMVAVSEGVLEGALATIVKRSSKDHYLVCLGEQNSQICARLPAHLLRAI